MITSRRGFLTLLAAPAIIRVADLMPVRGIVQAIEPYPLPGPATYEFASTQLARWAMPVMLSELPPLLGPRQRIERDPRELVTIALRRPLA